MKRTIAAHTLGCKTNQYDTQAMLEQFFAAGYELVDFDGPADVYLINTCSVTAMADKKSRQFIRRARLNSDAVVLACGCLSQRDSAAVLDLGADIAIGISRRGEALKLVEEHLSERVSAVEDVSDTNYEDLIVSTFDTTRALVKIQEGCDNFCTYCIIAPLRGNARSRSLSGIKEEADRLVSNGYKEIVLTGTNLASFGADTGFTLADAVDAVLRSGVERIRLGSLDPGLFTDEFIEFLGKNERICRHLHISLQSGCEATLKLMGRNYTAAQYASEVAAIRELMPNAAISTDVMVGFPGEDEAGFAKSLDFVKNIGFAKVHVFPFSVRPGTPAEKMKKQVPKRVKMNRAGVMQQAADESRMAYLKSMRGKKVWVLLETAYGADAKGYSGEYIRVRVPGGADKIGEIVEVVLDENNIVNDGDTPGI
jgi:threonylcarbamoyladenosine tRNA methylthiotransferase MtaB